MSRLEPIPPQEWPAEMKDALASMIPENARHAPPPRDPSRPKGLNVLGMFAHHPGLAKAYNTFNGHILFNSTITPRQRELLVLRVAHRRDAAYEWAQHVILARDAGITSDEIERVRSAPDSDDWDLVERTLLAATDELVDDARLSDDTFSVLSGELTTDQLMDVIFTVGSYDLLAMAMRSFDLELDDDLVARLASQTDGEAD